MYVSCHDSSMNRSIFAVDILLDGSGNSVSVGKGISDYQSIDLVALTP